MINKYISEMVAQEDKSTAEHSGRVAKIADILGRALRLSESELLTLMRQQSFMTLEKSKWMLKFCKNRRG